MQKSLVTLGALILIMGTPNYTIDDAHYGNYTYPKTGTRCCSYQDRIDMNPLKKAILDRADQNTLNRLLASNAPVDIRDERQRTPLHWAALMGDAAAAEMLLARGADVMAQDFQGNTPLHLATAFSTNYHERKKTIQVLLEYKAEILETNDRGYTPVELGMPHGFRDQLYLYALQEGSSGV